jgi:hypothetical protein
MTPPRSDHPFEADVLAGAADYVPAWDVPSCGRAVSDALAREVDAVRVAPTPPSGTSRKMHLVCGAPGYGKTHLFGRLRHHHGDRVQLVFVPAPPDPARAVEYVTWRVVETLFHSEGGDIAPVRRRLARVLAPSFAAYFDQLPAGLRARTLADHHALASEPLTVLQITGAVDDLAPYHALADAVRYRLSGVPGSVVRALVLSLSDASEDARAWLRGEADQVPDARLAALRLDEQSPPPADVVRGAAALCQLDGAPLVLCCDQLELLHNEGHRGFADLARQLMGWLHTVPNVVVVLGCVDETWKTVKAGSDYGSFADRVAEHSLPTLSADEGVDLLRRRLRSWAEYDAGRADGWPFDLAAVRRFVETNPASPRGFLKACKAAFDAWERTGRTGPIVLTGGPSRVSLDELFLRDWRSRLEATRGGLKAAHDYQEGELWEGVVEALKVAHTSPPTAAGVRLERFTQNALKSSPSDSRPSARLCLKTERGAAPVVVAVSKKDGGVAFGHWVTALEDALGGTAGAVVVRPKGQLAAGRNTNAYRAYQARVTAGSVRPFPLDEHAETFAHLECLRQLVRDARAGVLNLDGRVVPEDQCRELLARTGALANLPLFDQLFHNWPGSGAAAPGGPPAAPTAPPAHRQAAAPGQPGTKSAPPATAARPTASGEAPPSPQPAPPAGPGGEGWADRILGTVVEKLRNKGQPVRPVGVEVGPTFVRLKVEPRDEADFARVKKQADNLKLHLKLDQKPLIAAQAGYISIDVQRPDRQVQPLAPLLAARPPALDGRPAFPAGVDVAGRAHWVDLSDPASCHLLVAGTTGSGKSEFFKALLAGLATHLPPDRLRVALVDPKRVTFNFPAGSPYLLREVAYDVDAAVPLLEACRAEMTRRYSRLQQLEKEHVDQLTGPDAAPRWVVVFDEFADLMADKGGKKELEQLLRSVGAMGRAAGIHLVLGTQRPEASVVTPLLRSNLPGRVGLRVASEKDSKLFLEEPDAAHLLGKGDLVCKQGGGLLRLQCPLVTRAELEAALRCR